jgi:hypothetical protein
MEQGNARKLLMILLRGFAVPVGALMVLHALSADCAPRGGGADPARVALVSVAWDRPSGISKTELTVQVCPEPPMRRGGPIHRQAHEALRDLKMSYARLQPWFPYPKLSIAELEPPHSGKTSWDFSLIDPIVLDFYEAAQGRPITLNVAIPRWLFDGPPHRYPDDPNEIDWAYEFGPPFSSKGVGTKLRDPTFQEAADYFQRVAEWYIRGEFTDEYGWKHRSGHHLKIDYWEVLNEQEEGVAHELDPQVYTALYDTVVSKLRGVDPQMKFGGLALADVSNLHYFEYFLNPKNHKPGIPLDMVSYHRYIVAKSDHTPAQWQEEMFEEADRFLTTVRQVERIRHRLSPSTKTFVNEFGFGWGPEEEKLLTAVKSGKTDSSEPNIPKEYWDLAASVFAYVYLGTLRAGVDVLAAAELVDYPGQFAGTNLIHWRTGDPNPVYRVVKLLHEQLAPGVQLMHTAIQDDGVDAQAFDTREGRKLLVINKTRNAHSVRVAAAGGAVALAVDPATGGGEPRREMITSDDLVLRPHAVTLITWPLH